MLAKMTAVALISAGVVACAANPRIGTGPRQNTGTITEAMRDASVGSQTYDGNEETAAAAVGSEIERANGEPVAPAAAGVALDGLIGHQIGAAMDDEDKQRAYVAHMHALERGHSSAPIAWRNPDSGHYGSIVPGPEYAQRGTKCRQYTHTVYIDRKPQTARGTACRSPNGSWGPIS